MCSRGTELKNQLHHVIINTLNSDYRVLKNTIDIKHIYIFPMFLHICYLYACPDSQIGWLKGM